MGLKQLEKEPTQIDLKYLISEKDRRGNIRRYYREKPKRRIRIYPEPGTREFREAYHLAEKGIALDKKGKRKIEPPKAPGRAGAGSLRCIIEAYLKAPEFRDLDDSTRRVRRQILDRLSAETDGKGKPPYGERPAARMEPRHVRKIRDAHSDRPQAANAFVKALRQVFAYAIAAEIPGIKANPARDVPYLKSKGDGFHSWTVAEIEQFEARHLIGTKARMALAILLFLSQRRSDAVRFGPPMVRDGWLSFTQHKGRNSKPVHLELPVIDALQSIIDATPDKGAETWLVTAFGKPFTSNGFGNWFRKRCDEAGLPQCSAHGLRKAAASRLAELGCSDREIMAITGHRTSKEVDRYTRAARQRSLAASAMNRMAIGNGGEPARNLRIVG